ncbi:MAG: type II toxin-antitoxin system VapC family toxin [Methylacidiphilales bacterium]|nr:type II toxin-antitoxin system VapC family toxin [Candidatus Methylacidiphilales bacterium]NJR16097.1 type II toxin-antitoxin system VapC family toxin [Calothrix sp. CSU_2_0]
MSLWILDTDHTSLFLAGNKAIAAQVAAHSHDIAITVITVQELFNGWMGKLNDPAQANKLAHLYTKLWETTEFFKIINILNFDREAENCDQILRQSYKSLAKKKIEKDLRIASIALVKNAIIVTRNYKDFSQIPNLKIENWTE